MSTVIVGAGQAGAQLSLSLREQGYDGDVTLVGDEAHLPYQRPPLSKDYLAGELPEGDLPFRGRDVYGREGIDLITGAHAVVIRRAQRVVVLDDGRELAYGNLVLATGARNRPLRLDGEIPSNVLSLRTRDDAYRLRGELGVARRVLIIGAGFIGLEFASVAAAAGAEVTVVEMLDRVMARAVSADISAYFAGRHRESGVELLCDTTIGGFERDAEGRVVGVHFGHEHRPVDIVLVGIGVLPNEELAAEVGLDVQNGILVDQHLRTSDPAIYAIGDCARFPLPATGELVRLESVQNAADHARYLARSLTGAHQEGYADVPWFWSQQAGDKLQIAGLAALEDDAIVLGDTGSRKFSVCRLRSGALTAVESVNSAADHMAARRLFASGVVLTEDQIRAPGFSFKEALRTAKQKPAGRTLERTT